MVGVGVLIAEQWINSVIEVKCVSERVMVVRLAVGNIVLNLVSVYTPQVGRNMEDNEEFLTLLREVLSRVASTERLIVCGDFNGHVGADVDGVHGGNGFGVRNTEGEMLLDTTGRCYWIFLLQTHGL